MSIGTGLKTRYIEKQLDKIKSKTSFSANFHVKQNINKRFKEYFR